VPAGRQTTDSAPAGITVLAQRWDPDVIDLPDGRALIRLEVAGETAWDARVRDLELELAPANEEREPDAVIAADPDTLRRIAEDPRGAMGAFRQRRLRMRGSLHVGAGFLAATAGSRDPGRLAFDRIATNSGRLSLVSAGTGPETLLCLHGLGGTKASFLPTLAALAGGDYRVIALDLPGFGESDKPIGAPYDAPWFARATFEAMDALGLGSVHLAGNSMGGRVAIEAGLSDRSRVTSLTLLCPALAWLRDRRWAPIVRLLRPELGLLQMAPRRVVEQMTRRLVPTASDGWAAAGVDEFLRAYLTPRGRAAFYAAARNVYLDEPHGEEGFWTRLEALAPDALFIWGKRDALVPIGFMRHGERALPAARHVELDCGHVPQLERPRETHRAMLEFLRARSATTAR
jgi:pimeloyl-ACP methyl ester carboxylesterase